jgi:hypothetical protein
VAEWLRSGLQNRLHQFNSGRGLHSNPLKFLVHIRTRFVRRADLLPFVLEAL